MYAKYCQKDSAWIGKIKAVVSWVSRKTGKMAPAFVTVCRQNQQRWWQAWASEGIAVSKLILRKGNCLTHAHTQRETTTTLWHFVSWLGIVLKLDFLFLKNCLLLLVDINCTKRKSVGMWKKCWAYVQWMCFKRSLQLVKKLDTMNVDSTVFGRHAICSLWHLTRRREV